MIKGPCKNCPERDYPDCQIMCPRYLKFRAQKDAENNARRQKLDADTDYMAVTHRRWRGKK